ncbi:ankyrin repeat domain-containing protein [Pseudomonas sp. Hp2]|uniref:ankyrin repeat domain-containing protein n=1 Tax=Pseudomonas sp. Hp2 TaxID=701189 RepID=UPI00112A0ACF|nr:ankyrin repeat domain-containing protein [Pseudomonas sp. Hp2]
MSWIDYLLLALCALMAISLSDRALRVIVNLICFIPDRRRMQDMRKFLDYSALRHAVRNGDEVAVESLLTSGVSPNPPTSKFETECEPPLTTALQKGHIAIARRLVKAGADISKEASNEALCALAAVNPFRWSELTQEELDSRLKRANLDGLIFQPYVPHSGPFGNIGNGKSVVTNAVKERLAIVAPDIAKDISRALNTTHQAATEQDRERLVFDHLEQVAEQRMSAERREQLAVVAKEARPNAGSSGESRRAM